MLTYAALYLFILYSQASLLLENEPEKKPEMMKSLSFNCAKHDLDFSFNLLNKEEGSARATAKEKALSEPNIRKQLTTNYKKFKEMYNIFEKLPHFAVYRLKVMK